ncbi:MAG: 3'-5' exonuclease [Myxococcales bacterium]|nr:3'-5' exonuclease [Myxococcales bacterium]
MSILDRRVGETPFLVVDVETTGLDPRLDRVVEVCAVVVRPGEAPRVVLDTLVDPGITVRATRIHGITDEDVAGAPRFADLLDTIRALAARRVVAGHNVTFDLGFLAAEAERLGQPLRPPHFCTMRLPGLFGRPANWPLWWACQRNGVAFDGQAHSARGDARATTGLLLQQMRFLEREGVTTFGELAARARRMRIAGSFTRSFSRDLLPPPPHVHDAAQVPLRPRIGGEAGARSVSAERRYLDVVIRAVARLAVDEASRAEVRAERVRLGLDAEAARRVHARILSGAERRYAEDGQIDPIEQQNLDALRDRLAFIDAGLAPDANDAPG